MSIYRKASVRTGIAAVCLTLVATLSFAPIVPGSVQYAHAQLPVIDVAVLAAVSATAAASSVTAANTTVQTSIMSILNGIAWAVAKASIQAITKSMVNWINSGFNGSPAFVTNLDQNLLGVSDGVANSFFAALSNHSSNTIASPFQNAITQQLRNAYYSSTGRAVGGGYTLNQFSSNPAAFLAGQFGTNGGFNAWFAAVGNNQNNPYGAAYLQQNALNAAVYNATSNRLAELNWGKGFMSWRGPCTSTAAPAVNGIGNPTSLSSADNCTSYAIKTPGSIIEDSLGITVNSPLRQLELANSVNEIVGALASQLVNQVVGGVGLSGVSQPSSGGGASLLSQATDPSQYAQTSLASGFVQSVANDLVTAQTYLADWQKLQLMAQSCQTPNSLATSTVTFTNTNVARGTTAINALTKISGEAATASASNNPAQLSSVSTEYQNLISTTTGGYITFQDLSDAQFQSTTTPFGSATTSLFSTIAAACNIGT